MASTINPLTIDPTKPEEGQALTANVRANEAATQDNFTAAVNDIEALQADKADQTALDAHIGTGGNTQHPDATGVVSGFMTAADKAKLDAVAPDANDYTHPNHTGDVTSVGDGAQTIVAGAVTTDKIADGAVTAGKLGVGVGGEDNTASNVGAAAGEVFKQKTGANLEFKTLRSSDLSVTITDELDTVDLVASGVGGGQANDGANLGLGEGVFAQKNGLNLEFKSLVGGTGITISSTATEITVDADGGPGGTEFADDVFRINDDVTPTKQFAFEVAAVTAGQTRVMTIPDQDLDMTPGSAGTFAGINVENTFLESVTVNGQAVRRLPFRVTSSVITALNSPVLRLYNLDPAAAGADAGPAIDFEALDSASGQQVAGSIASELVNGTAGSFDAEMVVRTNTGAGVADRVAIHNGLYTAGATGGDQGADTVNASAYYADGVEIGTLYGDVSKDGTPVDNQIAVWTGDGTAEGTTGLEYADRAKLSLEGAAVISTLKNSEAGGEQVYADSTGQLFTVTSPEPSWSDSATDTGIYGPQSGSTTQPWEELTGLALTVGGDIVPGDRIDLAYRVEIIENNGHAGVVDIGFGIGVGVEPLPGDFEPHVVPADFAAAISGHQSSVNKTLSNGQAISLWFRIQSGTNPNFRVTANGAVSDHESFIASPAKGVGTGGTASEQHTWAVQGDISDGTLPGMFVMKSASETLNATRLRTILTGGSCTVQLNKNGTPLATATSNVGITVDLQDFTDEPLADGDLLTITVSGASSAQNLSISLELVRAF